jgi:hypothetical protein
MNIQFKKIIGIILALFFLSGCAVWVRDRGGGHYRHRDHYRHHDRGRWHHSLLQQSDQPSVQQMTAQNSGEEIPFSR